MNLQDQYIDFIQEHQDLLKENKFSEFYEEIEISNEIVTGLGEFTDFFIEDCGIDLFEYMDELPMFLFYYSKIEPIIIPSKFTQIPPHCFQFSYAKEIILPETIEKIGYYAFLGCSDLEKMSLPNNIEVIPGYCFEDCFKLNEIILPKNLTNIGEFAFLYCGLLQEITIPPKVKRIDEGAFNGCSGLKEVNISKNTEIAGDVFKLCSKNLKINYY